MKSAAPESAVHRSFVGSGGRAATADGAGFADGAAVGAAATADGIALAVNAAPSPPIA